MCQNLKNDAVKTKMLKRYDNLQHDDQMKCGNGLLQKSKKMPEWCRIGWKSTIKELTSWYTKIEVMKG
jgi:hypothetical protein